MDHDDAATPWRKSSYSNSGANCVEVARTRSGKVAVRDSKDLHGEWLSFGPEEWVTFLTKIRTTIPYS